MDRSSYQSYLLWLEEAATFYEACVVLCCASRDPNLPLSDFYALRYRFDSIYRLEV